MAAGANYELTANAIASGGGIAVVTFQAPNVGPRGLLVVSIALFVTPSAPIPQCVAYRNLIQASTVMATKIAGHRGTFIGTEDVLYMGQQIVLQWTGAAAGAQCSATLRGRPNA